MNQDTCLKREISFHERKFLKGEDFDYLYRNKPIWRIHWDRKYQTIHDYLIKFNGNRCLLNIGAGTGPIEFFLNRYEGKKSINIMSTDISKNAMINLKILDLNDNLILCDAKNLPFKSKSFDGVIFSGVLHHIPEEDLEEVIFEVRRTLKSGGILIAIEPFKNNIRKIIRILFPRKWERIHSQDERELDFAEIYNLNPEKYNIDKISIKPLGLFIDILLNMKINKHLEAILAYLYILDKILEKTGIGISHIIYIRFK